MRLDRRDFLRAAVGLALLPLASRLPAQDANKRGVHLLLDSAGAALGTYPLYEALQNLNNR